MAGRQVERGLAEQLAGAIEIRDRVGAGVVERHVEKALEPVPRIQGRRAVRAERAPEQDDVRVRALVEPDQRVHQEIVAVGDDPAAEGRFLVVHELAALHLSALGHPVARGIQSQEMVRVR